MWCKMDIFIRHFPISVDRIATPTNQITHNDIRKSQIDFTMSVYRITDINKFDDLPTSGNYLPLWSSNLLISVIRYTDIVKSICDLRISVNQFTIIHSFPSVQLGVLVAYGGLTKCVWHRRGEPVLWNINGWRGYSDSQRWEQMGRVLRVRKKHSQTSNISRTKTQNLNVSHLVLQLSLSIPLKPCVKSGMEM